MSADNAIIMLELKDRIFVAELGAFDNLWFSYIPKYDNSPVSARIFEYFTNAKWFRTKQEAFTHAEELFKKAGYVEYGIMPINVSHYTWDEIKQQAKQHLVNEVESLKPFIKYAETVAELLLIIDVLDNKISIDEWQNIVYQ